jgi:tRNA (adenine22-N1)-methyltransferase
MNSPTLTPRLRAAASFVRKNSVVADVGTDHAYLPIALVLEGVSKKAVASDINEGPYLRALSNVRAHSLSEKITALCTPGLDGIEKYSPTDILICGMGGELIASIIEAAPWTKNESILLVLQPMTHAESLRKYLLENGFSIIDEKIAKEEKLYQIICAEYTGKVEKYTELELLFGKSNIARGGELLCELISKQIDILKKIADAKTKSKKGENSNEEEKLIALMEELKNDCK